MRFPTPSERRKREILMELLADGMTLVQLNVGAEGVDVPERFREQEVLALNLSHAFQSPVFEINPLSVRASLSFDGDRYVCEVPYTAMFAMASQVDDRRFLFVDAVPDSLREALKSAPSHAAPESDAPEQAEPAEQATEDVPAKPQLRLVE